MCEICLKTPCDSRCPNAEEPEAKAICDICGYKIFDWEDYYFHDDKTICTECWHDYVLDNFLVRGE